EESLFTTPELKLLTGGGVRATLTATSGKSKDKTVATAAEKAGAKPVASETKLLADASVAVNKGDVKAAEQAYQDALRSNPKNTMALLSLAILKQQQKKYDDAKVLLQKCLVYEPDNDQAHYRLGVGYFQKNDMNEALNSFEKSIAKNKDNP